MNDSNPFAYEDGERYQNGERVLIETGAAPKALHHWRNIDPHVGPVIDRMLGEFCFGDVWDRPEIDHHTRRIITITTIATLGRDRKSTRLNSSHIPLSRMPSSA